MSAGDKVVGIAGARRRRLHARSEGRLPATGPDLEALRARIDALEGELAAARASGAAPQGLLVALARIVQEGLSGFGWASLARTWREAYFAYHSEDVDDFGYDRKFTETLRPFFEFLYTVWWRVEVDGIEHVPEQGAALIVANHSGVLPYDGLMINLAVRHQHPGRREVRMLALDMFALLPFLAPMLGKTGAARANPDNGERLLRRGELVGVFPEGVKGVGKYYKDRYRLARFGRGGFVRLALRTGAPIIPVAVVGAEEIHPVIGKADWVGRPLGFPYFPITPTFPALGPLGLLPLPSKWALDFADPIDMQGHGPEAADDPILVNRLSEQVRSTIQRMIDGRLARRRSVWFG